MEEYLKRLEPTPPEVHKALREYRIARGGVPDLEYLKDKEYIENLLGYSLDKAFWEKLIASGWAPNSEENKKRLETIIGSHIDVAVKEGGNTFLKDEYFNKYLQR